MVESPAPGDDGGNGTDDNEGDKERAVARDAADAEDAREGGGEGVPDEGGSCEPPRIMPAAPTAAPTAAAAPSAPRHGGRQDESGPRHGAW